MPALISVGKSVFGLLLSGLLPITGVTAKPVSADDMVKVEVVTVDRKTLVEEIRLTGTVTSPRIALLSTEVQGLIKAIAVDAGDRVDAGEALLTLDDELAEIEKERAQAAVAGARAALGDSQRRLEEARALAEQKGIAATEVRAREARRAIDQAELEVAEAEARRRRVEWEKHTITAPYGGTVTRKLAEVGEWLAPGAEVLELVGTDQLRVDFQVPQRAFGRIDEDTRVTIQFDAVSGGEFTVNVHRIVPFSSGSARTFLLRTQLEEPVPGVIPGMSANAVLQLSVESPGVTAPRDALQRYPDGRISVWVVEDFNAEENTATVREQPVETGLSFSGLVEVRSGLDPEQQVVTRGNEALREGQTVRIEARKTPGSN